MSLNASLGIASSGLAAIQYEMAVASQNVANAGTAGYVEERAAVSSRTAGGGPGGVLVGVTSRDVNTALQSGLYSQNATVAALTTTSNALSSISALQGSTSADAGSSGTLSDAVGNLQSSLISLEGDPSNSTMQQSVLSEGDTLTGTIRTLASAYQSQRQAAQSALTDDVSTLNSTLSLIGSLSDHIGANRSQGLSSADLENQRDAAMTTLSGLLSVQFKETTTGDMLVSTQNGLVLPTHAATGPLSASSATVNVGVSYPGTIPGIMLGSKDVTADLTGGSIGANLVLRDQTLPTMQAELDSFSSSLASRFDGQGLTLFSGAGGALPGSSGTTGFPDGQVGFANVIQVNPTVASNPSSLRDGSHDVTGSSDGASAFTVNTNRGSSDTTLIDRLVDHALGAEVQDGVQQPAVASSNLGLSGNLSLPYSSATDLTSLASTLTASQAATISQASGSLTNETAVQSALTTKITSLTGVSVDTEMSSIVALQNAYAANAKIVSAVQSMFSALLSAVS